MGNCPPLSRFRFIKKKAPEFSAFPYVETYKEKHSNFEYQNPDGNVCNGTTLFRELIAITSTGTRTQKNTGIILSERISKVHKYSILSYLLTFFKIH